MIKCNIKQYSVLPFVEEKMEIRKYSCILLICAKGNMEGETRDSEPLPVGGGRKGSQGWGRRMTPEFAFCKGLTSGAMFTSQNKHW